MHARGFTLIELLIVVAIIGILAAIAIPQFAAYRIRGYNAAAQADGKGLVTGEETYFNDNYSYLSIALQTGPGAVGSTGLGGGVPLPGVMLSKGVSGAVVASGSSITTAFFTLATSHLQGNRLFAIESDEGKWKYRGKTPGLAQTGADVTAATSAVDFLSDGTI